MTNIILFVARQLSCVTSPSLSGQAKVVITVKRSSPTNTHFTSVFAEGVSDTFVYATPHLNSMVPAYGPRSGGTLVVLTGSALNISNTLFTTVMLAGSPCIIQ